MRICHVSDTHGHIFQPNRFCNIVVHSGDMLPDPPYFSSHLSAAIWQKDWLNNKAKDIKLNINKLPFIFVNGNHDYLSGEEIEEVLVSNKIKATCINDKLFSFEGLNFYGFPWVKHINGLFSYELSDNSMNIKCLELKDVLSNNYINVLVAHGPMKDGLSIEGSLEYGNEKLKDTIFSLQNQNIPDYMLVGHIHLAKGIKYINSINMLVVNSATTIHYLEV